MISVRTAHTAQLEPAVLAEARAILYAVFDAWKRTLGALLGDIYALAFDGGELVGHAAVVERRLLHGGRAARRIRRGVGVRAGDRRRAMRRR